MKTIKRLWIPILLGVLLIATAVGVASASPNARPLEQGWRVLTVPAGACVPDEKADDWDHVLSYIKCVSGFSCQFFCPLDFPAAGEQAVGAVNVKRVTLYAYDTGGAYVQAWLYKMYPPTGGTSTMAWVTATASANDPEASMDTSIDSNPVYRSQAPYIELTVTTGIYKAYGFYIHYTW
jgi:hypothetical protein